MDACRHTVHIDLDPAVVRMSRRRGIDVGYDFKFQGERLVLFNTPAFGHSEPTVLIATDKVDRRGRGAVIVYLKTQPLAFAGAYQTKIQHRRVHCGRRQRNRWSYIGRLRAGQKGVRLVDLLKLAFGIKFVQRVGKAIRVIDAHQLLVARPNLFLAGSERDIEDIVIIFHTAPFSVQCFGELGYQTAIRAGIIYIVFFRRILRSCMSHL